VLKHDKKEYKITPMTFEEAVKFFFIIAPYIRMAKAVKPELDPSLFLEIVKNYLEQLNPAELNKAVGLLLHISPDEAKVIPVDKIIITIPRFVLVNNIYTLYGLLRTMGVFE
jgi:hypothetical protein